jgi:hypothetical protein
MSKTTTHELIIYDRDNWTESRLDAIERVARWRIVSHRDDGAGNMVFVLRPALRPTAPERKAILAAVQSLAPNARWA